MINNLIKSADTSVYVQENPFWKCHGIHNTVNHKCFKMNTGLQMPCCIKMKINDWILTRNLWESCSFTLYTVSEHSFSVSEHSFSGSEHSFIVLLYKE